jgi:hypothetical protein
MTLLDLMAPRLRTRIRPADVVDVEACLQIRYEAYRPGPMSRCLWPDPDGISPDAWSKDFARIKTEFEDGLDGG